MKKEGFTFFERLLRKYGKPHEVNSAITWNNWTPEKRKQFFKEVLSNLSTINDIQDIEEICYKYWNEMHLEEQKMVYEMYCIWFKQHKDDWKYEKSK
jgi:hypothetical protein